VNVLTAGTYTLGVRYSLGATSTRTLRLAVNGTLAANSLAFAPTGSWSTWKTQNVQVALQAGQNTVRITTTGTNGPNVDSLTVS